ncbi:MAG TPA: 30S ribosomal protein S13 [Verrucomicrobiae bacterium]|nr:30S ribosomal protein S13 [Verrucomicrobiae bacterium]
MARLIGVEVPDQKKIGIALRYIYGIGPTTALRVCEKASVDPNVRAKDLNDEQLSHLTTALQVHRIEGDLRREVQTNIKRLMSINCYRGTRHKKGLPVRGQRTSTNARTRKGPRKTVGVIRVKESRAPKPEA